MPAGRDALRIHARITHEADAVSETNGVQQESMVTNRDAYARLERASEDSLEAAETAVSGKASAKLLELSKVFDAELAKMVERGLMASNEPYGPLTGDFRGLKTELDGLVKNMGQFVETAEDVAQLSTSFARVLALL